VRKLHKCLGLLQQRYDVPQIHGCLYHHREDVDLLREILFRVVEDVGAHNIVQIVTNDVFADCTSLYAKAL
jgi:hypothetical protein